MTPLKRNQPILQDASIERRVQSLVEGPTGVRFFEISYASASRFARHAHTGAFLCLMVDGAIEERYGLRSRQASRGDVLWYEAFAEHQGALSEHPARVFHVEIDPARLEDWIPECRSVASHSANTNDERLQEGWLLQLRHLAFFSERVDDLLAASLVCEALGELGRSRSRRALSVKRLEVVRQRLQDDLEDPPSLSELGRLAGLHASHLARSFRQATGLTVGHYRRCLQVLRVARELRKPKCHLVDVACIAGFSDQSHMGRVFRQATGWTPAAYRSWVQEN